MKPSPADKTDVRRFASLEEASRFAADIAALAAQRSVRERGAFTLALSGGSSPLRFFELLAERTDVPWSQTRLFQVDERVVPRSDSRSNWRAIAVRLLGRIPIPPENVFPMPIEAALAATSPAALAAELEAAAARYEQTLRRTLRSLAALPTLPVFGPETDEETFPPDGQDEDECPVCNDPEEAEILRLDLVVLGMGPDGHTASIFPGRPLASPADGDRRLVGAEAQPGMEPRVPRLTLTLPFLNQARRTLFLIQGKERTLERVFLADGPGERLPAGLIRPRGDLLWLTAPEQA